MMNFLATRLGVFCLPLILIGLMMASCQKTQTASAEKPAAQVGDSAIDPLAVNGTGAATSSETSVNQLNSQAPNAATNSPNRNRFGFSGGDNADSRKPVTPLHRELEPERFAVSEEKPKLKERISNLGSDMREVAEAPLKKAEEKKLTPPTPPPAPAAPAVVKLGFANSVPGDPLHVTLPGEFAYIPSISVERRDPAGNPLGSAWPRGTQMQIPNPKVPGGKIYFKVP